MTGVAQVGGHQGREQGLRVALLSPCTWPEVRRGSERMFRDLGHGLVARGNRPWLITSHPGAPGHSVEDGIEVTRNWRPPDGRLGRRAYEEYLTHAPFTYLSLLRGAADVAHASHAPDAVAGVRWSRRTGRPVVFSFMGIPERRWLVARRARLRFMLGAVRGCHAVVALSRHAARAFATDLGVEARVIRPGVDLDAFSPGGERSPGPTIVCAASPDIPEKRVGLLVEALPHVRRSRAGTTLVLQRPRQEGLARTLAEQEGVELMEPDPSLLLDAYRRAWVSALPSRSEAFGLVLAESLACGTPVVGAHRGAIPELIDRPEVGRTFAVDDPRAVALALVEALELAQDPATASHCRRRATEVSVDRMVEAYESLYRELTEVSHHAPRPTPARSHPVRWPGHPPPGPGPVAAQAAG